MMASDLSPVRHDYPWSRIGWMSFAVIVLSSAFIGFVFLGRYQANSETLGVWAAICRGLGITADTAAATSPQPPLRIPTELAWTQATLDQIRTGNAQRGAFIALCRLPRRSGGKSRAPHSYARWNGCGGDLQATR
jgi:hypothetical protein